MENDSIRASGTDTLVDIWVNGKLRAISISKDAIAAFVGFERADMSDDERCEFVRTHLPQLVAAVKTRLAKLDPDVDSVTIDVGQLGGSSQQDRRKTERRKTDRRTASRPKEELPQGERRRGDRRKGDRRSPKG
jgi:hypothetical protein